MKPLPNVRTEATNLVKLKPFKNIIGQLNNLKKKVSCSGLSGQALGIPIKHSTNNFPLCSQNVV